MLPLPFIPSLMLFLFLVHYGKARAEYGARSPDEYQQNTQYHNTYGMISAERKPNIIFILTDDQDLLLGSMSAMNETRFYLGKGGANFVNGFVTSPMCCPSRSSILTGQYVHNHKVYSNIDSYCNAEEWRTGPEGRNFGAFLQAAKYRTGYFGKYLNNYKGDYIPPGWIEWKGLVHNSQYYNYTLNHNGELVKHGADYHRDYLPDLIANDSMEFFKTSKLAFPDRPVAVVLSFPSPHGPEDCAPQYKDLLKDNKLHRTPSWNYGPNPDKHWLLQYTQPMSELQQNFTDVMHRKRLLTLISVDEAVKKIHRDLAMMGELGNTFIIYTSDHGYHLGQYGVIKGKSMPYDFDIRVPFYMRGPGIPPGIEVPNIVLNIDIAPTILDMAGIPIPPYMDGVSILKLFNPVTNYKIQRKKNRRWKYVGDEWRDSFLVERSRSPEDVAQLVARLNKNNNRKENECKKPQYTAPCRAGQAKVCIQTMDGSWHIRKCRLRSNNTCECPAVSKTITGRRGLSREERKQQKRFLKKHVNKQGFKPSGFLRSKRETDNGDIEITGTLAAALTSDPLCRVEQKEVRCNQEVLLEKNIMKTEEKMVRAKLHLYKKYVSDLKRIQKYLKRASYLNYIPLPATQKPAVILSADRTAECICNDAMFEPGEEVVFGEVEREDGGLETGEDEGVFGSSHLLKHDAIFGEDEILERERRSLSKKELKKRAKKKLKKETHIKFTSGCKDSGMSCFYHDTTHWKTPPIWTGEPVCSCNNNQNNSYWCIRTLNSTHDFLYCEYVTRFVEFFDHQKDPYQLVNAVHRMEVGPRITLSRQVRVMKTCYGSTLCTMTPTRKEQFMEDENSISRRPNTEEQGVPQPSSTEMDPWYGWVG